MCLWWKYGLTWAENIVTEVKTELIKLQLPSNYSLHDSAEMFRIGKTQLQVSLKWKEE